MRTDRHKKRTAAAAALTLSAALLGGALTATAAHAEPEAPAFDYFAQSIPGLRTGSVFESVTYERFESLLKSDGTYAFLIGGPEDETVAAAAAEIDAVAQSYGVEAVYAFDPRLDGDAVDVRTSSIAAVGALWTNLTGSYLNRDTTPQFGEGDDPYLVIYDRAHTIGGAEDRIVASLGGSLTAAGLDSEGERQAYRTQVSDMFGAVASGGQAQTDTQSQFDFLSNAVNSRHSTQYVDASAYGGEILGAEQEQDFVIQSITYPELRALLESPGEHTILFGGTWCHNTRAVIRDVNDAAAAAGVETVYLFDLRLDGLSGNVLHIRDSASALSHLYGEIADGYLTNLRTQYQVSSASASHKVTYYPGGDTGLPLQTAKKLQVPYLIEYDADATDPILNDWIQDNGDGTFTEYMTEFWWVNGLPGSRNTNRYPATPEGDANWAAEQAKQWAFGASALEALDGFFDRSGEEQEEPPVVLSGATPTVSAKKLAVGQKLTAKAGSWGPTGVKLSYQWLRNGKAISKATKSSYTLTASDRGKKISLRVTGALAGAEPLARTSKSTSAVKYGALKSATPKVSGTAKAKKTLKAKAGSWGPKGVKLSYQWLRNGKKISGATKSSYKVSSKDRGKKISVKVTGKLSGYSTVSKTSAKKSVKR